MRVIRNSCGSGATILLMLALTTLSPLHFLPSGWAADADASPVADYDQSVLADKPLAYWDFQNRDAPPVGAASLSTKIVGRLQLASGPASDIYPVFASNRKALAWPKSGRLVVENAPALQWANGEALTMEAWVRINSVSEGAHTYIVGKGRTRRPGYPAENQNYALRLTGDGGRGMPSFLFRSKDTKSGAENYHRWTAARGISTRGWHHIAVSYRFGQPKSITCVVDGRKVSGAWDMGGPTASPPIVDDDQLWIGSSIGGNSKCTLHGSLASLAIYRRQVPVERLTARYAKVQTNDWRKGFAQLPAGKVQVAVYANVADGLADLEDPLDDPRVVYQDQAFAATALPRTYLPGGVLGPHANPQWVRMAANVSFEQQRSLELLIRAKSGSRLWIDGEPVAETAMMKRAASGHEQVPKLVEPEQGLAALAAGHQEKRVRWTATPGQHLVVWDVVAGGKGVRIELGEAMLALRSAGSNEPFRIWQPDGQGESLTEAARARLLARLDRESAERNAAARQASATVDDDYWKQRHEQAAEVARTWAPAAPRPVPGYPANNPIDHFLNAKLKVAGIGADRLPRLTSPSNFLRRLSLDVRGVAPSAEQWQAFHQASEGRRQHLIRTLLDSPDWADNWVSYWQDVLAENPGILKPKLNNTGPFRYWIHESFADNKSFDRFVTELIQMRGSVYDGGPGGFGLATQNDVPMASKAHVVATAFLGVELKCARCHDAPYHPYTQEQLMGLAAYLKRSPIQLPASSTVPVEPGGRKPLVTISLKPGAKIEPQWPFEQWVTPELVRPALPSDADARDEFAALVTSPHNQRFAEVIVNRMWQRYFGRGLSPGLGDWHETQPSHPELLSYLAAELVSHDYDLKHVARLIFESHAYQREVVSNPTADQLELFATAARRRMTAEQLLDSLLHSAGKPLDTEMLSLDPEGRRPSSTFLNLGVPRRAWEFTSLSNERDRPALALPAAQSMVDLLVAFGWRDSRPNPVDQRNEEPTVLQPLSLANGIAGLKVTRLSDDHVVTGFAMKDQPLTDLIRDVCHQILTRDPTPEEAERFHALLTSGYDTRIVTGAKAKPRRRLRNPVSWSNHLNHQATRIKLELEKQVRQGDPPTERLVADWRERLEDMVWALVNSPEYLFIP